MGPNQFAYRNLTISLTYSACVRCETFTHFPIRGTPSGIGYLLSLTTNVRRGKIENFPVKVVRRVYQEPFRDSQLVVSRYCPGGGIR